MVERTQQVQLMRQIYSRSLRTISWLGAEADDSTRAIKTIRTIAKELSGLDDSDQSQLNWLERYPELLLESTPTVWDSMDQLWKRDYWTRIWIVQEVILAPSVLLVCGSEAVSWSTVLLVDKWAKHCYGLADRPSFVGEKMWNRFTRTQIFNPRPVQKNELLRERCEYGNGEVKTENHAFAYFSLYSDLKATDPRDKVFGMLGLCEISIIPDYTKSARDVYIETAVEFYKSEGLTRLLNSAIGKNPNHFALPSWVPDWSVTSWSRHAIRNPEDDKKPTDETSGRLSIEMSPQVTLAVQCLAWCEVCDLEPQPENLVHDDAFEFGRVSLDILLSSKLCVERYGERPYVTGVPPLQALLRLLLDGKDVLHNNSDIEVPSENFFTLCATFVAFLLMTHAKTGRVLDEGNRPILAILGLTPDDNFGVTLWRQFAGLEPTIGEGKSLRELMPYMVPRIARLAIKLGSRLSQNRIFFTSNGCMGIGPDTMKGGDMIYLLRDCYFPVVLRKEGSSHTLVGTCLIEGFMDGRISDIISKCESLEEVKLF